MAKAIGFKQSVADEALAKKRKEMRAKSIKNSGKRIHFLKDEYKLPNPVLT